MIRFLKKKILEIRGGVSGKKNLKESSLKFLEDPLNPDLLTDFFKESSEKLHEKLLKEFQEGYSDEFKE